jgi:hypothetical protein
MSQKVIRKNVRVVIEPEINPVHHLMNKPPEEIERLILKEANRLVVDIKRHVDDAHPEVRWDSVLACEFCGDESDWEGEPVTCCQASLDEKEANGTREESGE